MAAVFDIATEPLLLPITVALLVGALAYLSSRVFPGACRLLALVGSLAVLYVTLPLLRLSADTPFGWQWLTLEGDITFSIDMVASPLGKVILVGAAAFSLLVSIYSFRASAGSYWEGKFYAYLLWALAGTGIVALAGNLLVLLVGWEIVTLMLYLMLNQGSRDAKAGAAKAYGMLGFSDACFLLAIALLAGMTGGSANWSLTRGAVSVAEAGPLGYVVYLLIMVAALAKAGAIPVHTWIPSAAPDAPTPVMALLPAAIDKLLGIYLLFVLSWRMFKPDAAMQGVMMIVGAVTILAAVIMAMMQHNLKRLLAFHAVSQVGYMVLGLGTGSVVGIIGGLFHMLNNVIYKSNLFLMSGTISRACGSDEIEDMGGLARRLPVTFGCSIVAAAAISGVPPFNGFVSKWLVYQAALNLPNHAFGMALVVVAVFGSALTLASFVKIIYAAFLSPAPADRPVQHARESFFLAAPMVVLAIACVVLGLWPGLAVDWVLAPAVAGTGQSVVVRADTIETGVSGLWSPSQATVLVLVGIGLGLLMLWISGARKRLRMVRPFLAGEVAAADDDRFRVPATHFYETVGKLPILGALIQHGQAGAMDSYHWSGKYGHTFVEMMRRWHTGLISLYVAWCLLGIIVTLVYLLLSRGP